MTKSLILLSSRMSSSLPPMEFLLMILPCILSWLDTWFISLSQVRILPMRFMWLANPFLLLSLLIGLCCLVSCAMLVVLWVLVPIICLLFDCFSLCWSLLGWEKPMITSWLPIFVFFSWRFSYLLEKQKRIFHCSPCRWGWILCHGSCHH